MRAYVIRMERERERRQRWGESECNKGGERKTKKKETRREYMR